ncbi:hypothetical protein GCM10010365_50800 [Streptomyces poonensis]|uniref:Uncharacterized protein n=1 Tax=Streptomyces poonensis TaxID=68255 RepID=A0A918UP95_9ACTN|nr:hypothetical protein GCM10010365_50800 [Streptomyces poonensis]GLJ89966.1 hypothetical protein GCM10017589_25670 [Streptomyces poonensis]
MAVLPELSGGLPVPDLLGTAHPQCLEAECRQGEEVVGLLGLGLPVQDLTPGALDLMIHVQLAPLEVDSAK